MRTPPPIKENATLIAYLVTSLLDLHQSTLPPTTSAPPALHQSTKALQEVLLAPQQPRRVYRHRFSGADRSGGGQRIYSPADHAEIARQNRKAAAAGLSRPIKGAIVIGCLFLFLTLSLTTAVVIFCKKKNTVFVFQKSDQDDFDEESHGGDTIFDDDYDDDLSSCASSSYIGRKHQRRKQQQRRSRSVDDFANLELGQMTPAQQIDYYVAASAVGYQHVEPQQSTIIIPPLQNSTAWEARPWRTKEATEGSSTDDSSSRLSLRDLNLVQIRVANNTGACGNSESSRTISLIEEAVSYPPPTCPPPPPPTQKQLPTSSEVAQIGPTRREYDLPFDERLSLACQTIEEVSEDEDEDEEEDSGELLNNRSSRRGSLQVEEEQTLTESIKLATHVLRSGDKGKSVAMGDCEAQYLTRSDHHTDEDSSVKEYSL